MNTTAKTETLITNLSDLLNIQAPDRTILVEFTQFDNNDDNQPNISLQTTVDNHMFSVVLPYGIHDIDDDYDSVSVDVELNTQIDYVEAVTHTSPHDRFVIGQVLSVFAQLLIIQKKKHV